MYQNNFVYLVCGKKKSGKTTLCKKIIQQSKRNAAIYQSLKDKNFDSFKKFTGADFEKVNEGKKRTSEAFIDYEDFILFCIDKVKRSEILIDDFTGYEADKISKPFKKLISRNRHSENNIFVITHSLSDTPKRMFFYADYLILFHTADTLEEMNATKRRFPQYEEIFAAVKTLQTAPKHAHIKIEL